MSDFYFLLSVISNHAYSIASLKAFVKKTLSLADATDTFTPQSVSFFACSLWVWSGDEGGRKKLFHYVLRMKNGLADERKRVGML